MVNTILAVLKSERFANRLNEINKNYPNLKHENLIRNSVLEILNDQDENYLDNNSKAFAEHPRDKGSRIDLSIINNLNHTTLINPYTIEFKFQYTNDFKQFSQYDVFIENDFNRSVVGKQCDLFILIICYWKKDKKEEFDKKWGFDPKQSLSRFLSLKEDWKVNLDILFAKYPDTALNNIEIIVKEPYTTIYNFRLMSRNN